VHFRDRVAWKAYYLCKCWATAWVCADATLVLNQSIDGCKLHTVLRADDRSARRVCH
jgi:hypothetical protein